MIRVDNKGVISAVQGLKGRVLLRRWVNGIRELVQGKELTIKYSREHQREVGNDLADTKAKGAISLPIPMPIFSKELWQMANEGELVDSPHKVWAKLQVLTHSPDGIHPKSWQPWKRGIAGVPNGYLVRLMQWVLIIIGSSGMQVHQGNLAHFFWKPKIFRCMGV